MSDNNDGKKPLGVRGGGAGGRSGNVKQSFSHGRTKNVVVETKRKRVVTPKPGAAKSGGANPKLGDPSKRPAGITDAEMERRLKALQAAKAREAEEQAAREAEEQRRAEERERRRAEIEAKEAAAADRIFGLLPNAQGQELRALWDEFEAAESDDAVFAKSVDRVQPVNANLETGGGSWVEYKVSRQQLEDRVGWKVAKGAPDLWDHLQARIGAWFEANAEKLEA